MMQIEGYTNAVRAGLALTALTEFVAETRVDTARDAISDLIADLLHLAQGRGFEPQALADQAVRALSEEMNDDPDGDMTAVQARFRDMLPEDGLFFSTISH